MIYEIKKIMCGDKNSIELKIMVICVCVLILIVYGEIVYFIIEMMLLLDDIRRILMKVFGVVV